MMLQLAIELVTDNIEIKTRTMIIIKLTVENDKTETERRVSILLLPQLALEPVTIMKEKGEQS